MKELDYRMSSWTSAVCVRGKRSGEERNRERQREWEGERDKGGNNLGNPVCIIWRRFMSFLRGSNANIKNFYIVSFSQVNQLLPASVNNLSICMSLYYIYKQSILPRFVWLTVIRVVRGGFRYAYPTTYYHWLVHSSHSIVFLILTCDLESDTNNL